MHLKRRRPGPPWNLWDAFFGLVLVFVINNVVTFVVTRLNLPWSKIGIFAFASVFQVFCFIGVVLYYVMIKYRFPLDALGLKVKDLNKIIATGLGGGFFVLLSVIISGRLVERFVMKPAELQPFARLVLSAETLPQLILLFIIGAILAPLSEEIYFRGFFYQALRSYFDVPLAIVLSGAVFGLLHFDLVRFIPLAVGGIGLAWLFERTGSVYTPFIAHGLWNFIMLLLLVINRDFFI